MPKRKKPKKVTKDLADSTVWAHTHLWQAARDIKHAQDQFIDSDFGGCLQNVEFALQELETAKAKLMKV